MNIVRTSEPHPDQYWGAMDLFTREVFKIDMPGIRDVMDVADSVAHCETLTLTLDDVVVAAAAVSHSPHGYSKIDCLATHEDHRGEGLGFRVLDFAEVSTRFHGNTRVGLVSSVGTAGFYEARGYTNVSSTSTLFTHEKQLVVPAAQGVRELERV